MNSKRTLDPQEVEKIENQKSRDGKNWRAFLELFADMSIYNFSVQEMFETSYALLSIMKKEITPFDLCSKVCKESAFHDETGINWTTRDNPKLAMEYAKHVIMENKNGNNKRNA